MSNSAVRIYVNDAPADLFSGQTVMDLARRLGADAKKGVAVALNGEVVPRSEWARRPLAAEDRLLVIQATQGG